MRTPTLIIPTPGKFLVLTGPVKILKGRRYGRLFVLRPVGLVPNNGGILWLCWCACGKFCVTRSGTLQNGGTTSCGCLRSERTAAAKTLHGHTKGHGFSRTYNTWRAMIARCCNPHGRDYRYYGGRGIKVCKRWRVFTNFLADMGERPVGKTSDRKNVNGNYTKSNCRWATKSTQMRNRRKWKKHGH